MNKKETKHVWYLKNKENILIRAKKLYAKNKQQKIEYSKEWRKNNWDRWYTKHKLRVKLNIDKVRNIKKAWKKSNPKQARKDAHLYRLRHPEKRAAMQRERELLRISAMPLWVNRSDILHYYEEARKKTIETGILHHVDHFYPIKHPRLTGLHVPWNLRVIPAIENQVKGNRLISA